WDASLRSPRCRSSTSTCADTHGGSADGLVEGWRARLPANHRLRPGRREDWRGGNVAHATRELRRVQPRRTPGLLLAEDELPANHFTRTRYGPGKNARLALRCDDEANGVWQVQERETRVGAR